MDGHRRAPRRHAHPRSGRCGRGRLSLVPFFADPKKGTRAAAAARNRASLRGPTPKTIVHAPRQHHSEILRDAQDDKSRRQRHGTRQACEATRRASASASARARSFAMLRMTRAGGSRTEQGKLAMPRARAIAHAPHQRQSEILRDAQQRKTFVASIAAKHLHRANLPACLSERSEGSRATAHRHAGILRAAPACHPERSEGSRRYKCIVSARSCQPGFCDSISAILRARVQPLICFSRASASATFGVDSR